METAMRHPYHLVEESPWPLTSAFMGILLTSGLVKLFSNAGSTTLFLALGLMLLIMFQWWRDISMEATLLGYHSKIVELGLRWGMILFIVSEVFFFVSFFWAFFHSSLAPDVEMAGMWPPAGLTPFNPFSIPLLNTLVLLSSGVTVTWAHHSVMEGNHSTAMVSLAMTVGLGLYFTMLQAYEYLEASFSISDGVYGSSFFLATGFHGLHVIVGSLFLLVCLSRLQTGQLSASHHFGFEAAAWYWHFVDVVWLFLFVSIYWWGGK